MKHSCIGIVARDDIALQAVATIADILSDSELVRIEELHAQQRTPDLVITLGGDGTLLAAIDYFPSVPTVGINFGTVGFLTAAHQDQLTTVLERIKEGSLVPERRTLLAIEYRGQQYYAFNEVVVKGMTKVVEVDVVIDTILINQMRGDGVIVGTSSGSTAYLLATGTPIVTPSVDCFIINGLNEYSLSRNSLIVDSGRTVTIRVRDEQRGPVYMVYDGKPELLVEPGEEIIVRRAPFDATLLFLDENHFFTSVQYKLKYGQCRPGV